MTQFYCKKVSLRPWPIIGVFGFFLFIGLIFLSGNMNGVGETSLSIPQIPFISPEQEIGLIFTIIAVVALSLVLSKTSNTKQYYEFTENSLLIKASFRDKIALQEIKTIELFSNEQAKSLFMEYYSKQNSGEKDPSGQTYSSDELICYSISPFTIWYQGIKLYGAANTNNIIVKVNGEFVLLTLNNGKKFLLSPDEREKFLEEFMSNKKVQTI